MPKGNARSSGYERQAQDWYCEPPEAVRALLSVEIFPPTVWDPACGKGTIPHVCQDLGIDAIGTDIVQRGGAKWTVDFLESRDRAESVITNPPFNLAVEFTLKALTFAHKVAVLQRLTWLEGKTRHERLFSKGHLARVWQFSGRISMPPGDSESPAKGGSVAFAWFVFDPKHVGTFRGGWLP